MNNKVIPIIVGAVGLVLVLLSSILGWVVLPKVIDKKIEEEVRLIPDSDTWNKWADITLPIQIKFYIFEVTNADEVVQGGYPILKEHGPFVYNEKRKKTILAVEGDTITYRQPIFYTFNEAASESGEDTAFDIINVAYISVLDGIEDIVLPPNLAWLKTIIIRNIAGHLRVNGETIIRKVTVKDLFFNGYDVQHYFWHPILNLALSGKAEFYGKRFGLYNQKNGADEGEFVIRSGVQDSSVFGQIVSIDGKNKLGYWILPDKPNEDTHCDMINGTDGSIFPPFVEKDRVLRVFVTDLCRSLYLTYREEIEFMGIKGYRFTVPKDMLDDPRINKDNRCFCLETDEDFETKCPGGGAIDVAVCREGAPIVMSAPYFLDGDYKYYQHLNIRPDRSKHLTTMDLEPNSGVLLQAQKRLQVNIQTKNYAKYNIKDFMYLKDMLFPLIWVEENASVDEESADELKSKLLKPLKIVDVSKWTVLGVGIFATVAGVGWLAYLLFGKSAITA